MAIGKMSPARVAELSSEPHFALIRHSLVFMSPERLTDVSAWHRHIPFAFWCIAELRPRLVVELGTHKGDSYSAFCQAVDRLSLPSRGFAVDTWKGDEHSGKYGAEVYQELAAYHDSKYGHFSVLLKSTFDNAVNQFGDGCIDLLHIDGCHTYDAVRHDFETWIPKLSADALVLFHDVAVHEKDFGVWRFWGEVSQKYPSFEFVHGHGLGVLAMGGQAEELLDRLRANAEQARYIFSRLGEMVVNADQIAILHGRHVERESEITRLRTDAIALRQNVTGREGELTSLRAEAAALRQAATEREGELTSLRAEAAGLRQAVKEREDELTSLRAEAAGLRQAVKECEGELTSLRAEAARLRQTVKEREGELTSLRAEAAALRQTMKEREGELGRLGAELVDVHESASWRLTALLREIWRFGDRLRRALWPRTYRFKLHSARQLSSINAVEGSWQEQGPDRQFLLIPERGRYPSRWCELNIKTNYPGAEQFAVLYVDLGGGFSEDRAIVLAPPKDGALKAVIELPRLTHGLRLDPCHGTGRFEFKEVVIREISRARGNKLKARQDLEVSAVTQPSANGGAPGLLAVSASEQQASANGGGHGLDATAFVRDRLKAEFAALPITALKKPKIVFASHEATRTGAPLILLNLVQHFARAGYELFLFCDAPGPLLDAFGEHAHIIKGWTRKPLESSPTTDDSFEDFGRERPILAICNTAIVPHYSEAFRRFGIPVVTLVHELADRISESYLRWIYGTSDRIVFPAEFVRKAANAKLILPKDKAVVIPQGLLDPGIANGDRVSAHRIVCQRLGVPAESFLVLGCGTVDLRKGTDLFVNLAHTVLRKTDAPVHFVWVGTEYDENLLPFFARKDLANFGIADRVHFVGPQDAPAVFFQASNAFVLTSREDPFPCVVLEAMAAGTPVIAFAEAGGAPEALAEGCGVVVGYRDIGSMADAVLNLYHNPEKAAQLSASAKKRVLEKYRFEDYHRALVLLAQDQLGVSFEPLAEGEEARQAPSGSSYARRSQEQRDLQLIKKDGDFDPDFFLSPFLPYLCGDAAIESFLRGWAEGALERKPCSGFNPYIYAAEALTETEAGIRNPFAHFIEKGKPQGRWLTPLIRPPFEPTGSSRLRMALHVHAYYPDLFDAFLGCLASNRSSCDLFVSTAGKKELEWLQKRVQAYDKGEVHLSIVPNRGRDLRPFLTEYNFLDGRYDLVGHVHCKKSLHFGTQLGELWRQFLWRSLLGPDHPMMDVIARNFETDPTLGLVFPDDPNLVGWRRNKQLATHLARRMGMNIQFPDAFEFPVGSMFWCRPAALRPLFELGLSWDNYPPEPLPIDGTMLHAIERLLPFVAESQGYRFAATHIPGLTR
jgi:glycosyltransferase involved in cell wall biosynthesis